MAFVADDDLDLAVEYHEDLLGAVGVGAHVGAARELEQDRGGAAGPGAPVHGPGGAHDVASWRGIARAIACASKHQCDHVWSGCVSRCR
jgi:hypothetical protein